MVEKSIKKTKDTKESDIQSTLTDPSIRRSGDFLELMKTRRSYREFSDTDIPVDTIKNCVRTAGLAPSGANMQPWSFVIVRDKQMKKKIRHACERIEKEFYEAKISDEWRDALKPLGTDFDKPFLEEAPYLIIVLMQRFGIAEDGSRIKHYYPSQSIGIATGMLISALHAAGLSVLTYTPSPMGFVNELLGRPENEQPYMILPVGYPKPGHKLPDIRKKAFNEICSII